MLSHMLEGWMMSKLLSLKAAKLSPPASDAGRLKISPGIRVDRAIPLRSQATLQWLYENFIILTFSSSCVLYLLVKKRAQKHNNQAFTSLFSQPAVSF